MSIFKIKKNFPKNSKFFCEFSKRIAYTYPMFNFPAQNHEIIAFLTLSQYFFNITSHLNLNISKWYTFRAHYSALECAQVSMIIKIVSSDKNRYLLTTSSSRNISYS